MRRWIIVMPVLLATAVLARVSRAESANSPSPSASSKSGAQALFEELTPEASGIRFVHRLDPQDSHAYLYHSGYACGGVCAGDIDGDAMPDIFLVSGPDENALFVNRGGCRFERRADAALGDS